MTSAPVQLLLSKLEGVKSGGRGSEYAARCPAHDDRHQSLNIGEGDDGRVLLKCHAGCSTEDVIAAMGLAMGDLFPHDAGKPTIRARASTTGATGATSQAQELGRIVAIYDYQDANGALLFQAVRYEHKDFRQRRPDGRGGWINNLRDIQPVLYRLPELLASGKVDPAPVVFIVEGEKDADRLTSGGLIATTSPMGAGKWCDHYVPYLAGRHVVILPDNDDPGRKHAREVALALSGTAASVRIIELEGLPAKGDVSDWLQAGGTLEQLQRLAIEAPIFTGEAAPGNAGDTGNATGDRGDKQGRGPSQATRLVAIADSAGVTLFHTPEPQGYADFHVNGHTETWPIKRKGFSRWLVRAYYNAGGTAPGSQAIQDATGVLEGRAIYEGPERTVHVRLARHEGAIYLDLANDKWQAIRITAAGWHVVDDPPVKFRRANGMLALPTPARNGHINMLRPFINVATDKDWALIAGFLVAALRPEGPYPLLGLVGEPGSAKSTTARFLRSLTDPSMTPLRSEPRNEHELVIAARNSWLPTFDNLSHIPAWLSDSLCRLATGGGFAARELYADDEEVLFAVMRPTMMTSITDVATYPDLLDRCLLISLKSIPEEQRQAEDELHALFEAARPGILGGLLDAVSCAMGNLATVKMDKLPRMADFAKWATAAEGALGLGACGFMKAFDSNRLEADNLSLESEPVAAHLIAFMEGKEQWIGSASDLLKALNAAMSEAELRAKDWPKRADKLSGRLKRIAPNLRRAGIDVDTEGRNPGGKRARYIELRRVVQSSVPSVPSVPHAPVASEVASLNTEVASLDMQVASRLYAQRDARDARDASLQPYSNNGPSHNGHGAGIVEVEI